MAAYYEAALRRYALAVEAEVQSRTSAEATWHDAVDRRVAALSELLRILREARA